VFFAFVLGLSIFGPVFILISHVDRIYHANAEEARQLKASKSMKEFKDEMQSIRNNLKEADQMIQASKDLRDIETELRYKQLKAEARHENQ
jgi:uncharacterized membrane protein (DUF106 family)